jgi:hypothetical protein
MFFQPVKISIFCLCVCVCVSIKGVTLFEYGLSYYNMLFLCMLINKFSVIDCNVARIKVGLSLVFYE